MYFLGEWLVDPPTRRVSHGSELARLSPKAMGVLTVLHDAGGTVVSRDALLDAVWPDVTVGEEVLTHAIAELRKALGDDPRQPRYIGTVHKSGYRLLVGHPAPTVSADGLDLESYASYLDASELFFRGGRPNVSLAADKFTEIIKTDPTNALAHAGLANSLFFLDNYFGMPGDNCARVEESARNAVTLNQGAPEAHAALGLALSASGRHDQARASFTLSVKLNPHFAESHYLLGRACFANGDYRLAATMLERAAALRSDDFHSLLLASKARRFVNDTARGQADLIMASHRVGNQLLITPDDRRALCDKIFCMVELGEEAAAAETAASLLHDPDPNHYYLVCGLARVGEIALALDCLETVIDTGWSHGAWIVHDRDLDPLRHEPRFRRLVAELELP